MDRLDEIRMIRASLIECEQDDTHPDPDEGLDWVRTLLAAVDTLTAERDAAIANMVCEAFKHKGERDELLEQAGRLVMERDAAQADAREWLRENEAELRWCLKNAIAERDALKARVRELEAQWVSVLLSVRSSLVPQSQANHRSFRDGWMAAIDYALQLLDKEGHA